MPKKKVSTERARRSRAKQEEIAEILLAGELNEQESDVAQRLLEVPAGGVCTIYFDSPGGSPYVGLALMNLMLLRELRATGVVIGECSSAAILPFAACQRRLVTPHSALLFHPMRWESDQNISLKEAGECARHFRLLENDIDQMLSDRLGIPLVDVQTWTAAPRFVTAAELVERGVAELVPLGPRR